MTEPFLDLRPRLSALGFYGIVASYERFATQPWLAELLTLEEQERRRRSLLRRTRLAKLGSFKAMADFDWSWPKRIDRVLVDELMTLRFVEEHNNVLIVGPNGVGKTMLAHNLLHQAIAHGYTAQAITAAALLADLGEQDSASALVRRIRHYSRPTILLIDELGYLSYDQRAADMLFQLVNSRYRKKPIVITTNKSFSEWNEIFPSASCVVSLIDRLAHNAEILPIEAESYRLHETRQRQQERARRRKLEA
jgi:DNA replication protein DnaC